MVTHAIAHFDYRPLTEASKLEILNALRVSDTHSRTCDIDHCCGREHRRLHRLFFTAGFQIVPYKWGNKSPKALELDEFVTNLMQRWNDQTFDSSGLESFPLFELLPAIKD